MRKVGVREIKPKKMKTTKKNKENVETMEKKQVGRRKNIEAIQERKI